MAEEYKNHLCTLHLLKVKTVFMAATFYEWCHLIGVRVESIPTMVCDMAIFPH